MDGCPSIIAAYERNSRPPGTTEDVALGNIARDDQRVGLLLDGLAELAPRGFAGMIRVDVGRPGEFHGLFAW
jgi:hypothetical protein